MLIEMFKIKHFTCSRTEISSMAVALNWRDSRTRSGSCSACSSSKQPQKKKHNNVLMPHMQETVQGFLQKEL